MLYAEKLEGVVYSTESINAKNDKAFRPKNSPRVREGSPVDKEKNSFMPGVLV